MPDNFYTGRQFEDVPTLPQPEADGLGFIDTLARVTEETSESTAFAETQAEVRLIEEYVKGVNEQTGGALKDIDTSRLLGSEHNPLTGASIFTERKKFDEKIKDAKQNYPNMEVKSLSQIRQEASQTRRAAEIKAKEGTEGESLLGTFAGTALGFLSDPSFVASSAIGISTGGILGMIGVNMATEAAYQSVLGDKPLSEKVEEVGIAGVVSGVLGVAGKGLTSAFKKVIKSVKSKGTNTIAKDLDTLADEMASFNKDKDPMTTLMEVDVRSSADMARANPLGDTIKAKNKNAEYVTRAAERFNQNKFDLPELVEGAPRKQPSRLTDLAGREKNFEKQVLRGTEAPSQNRLLPEGKGITQVDEAIADVTGVRKIDIDRPVSSGDVISLEVSKSKMTTAFDSKGKPMIFEDSGSAQRALHNLAEKEGNLPSVYKIAATKEGRFAVVAPTDAKTIPGKVYSTKEIAEAKIAKVAKDLDMDVEDITAVKLEDGKYGLATNTTEREVLSMAEGLPNNIASPRSKVKMDYDIETPIPKVTEVLAEPLPDKTFNKYVNTRIEQILSTPENSDQFAKSLGLASGEDAVNMIKDVRTVIKKFSKECMNV